MQEQEEISDKQAVYTVVNGTAAIHSYGHSYRVRMGSCLTLCERNHVKVLLFGALWDMVPNGYLALNEP